ncbi:hypothetical protein C8J57DRAFT_1218743 [Mycena rebaudengoi]|nr:hypothetical protein C8J57DRAFT_1218743 [Mycena rebaudengoi]
MWACAEGRMNVLERAIRTPPRIQLDLMHSGSRAHWNSRIRSVIKKIVVQPTARAVTPVEREQIGLTSPVMWVSKRTQCKWIRFYFPLLLGLNRGQWNEENEEDEYIPS